MNNIDLTHKESSYYHREYKTLLGYSQVYQN